VARRGRSATRSGIGALWLCRGHGENGTLCGLEQAAGDAADQEADEGVLSASAGDDEVGIRVSRGIRDHPSHAADHDIARDELGGDPVLLQGLDRPVDRLLPFVLEVREVCRQGGAAGLVRVDDDQPPTAALGDGLRER
jgi:hypothetical protein